MALADLFSDEQLAAVRAATRQAEKATGGELVCVIVERCDTYEEAPWKAATLGALGGVLASAVWFVFGDFWGAPPLLWIVLPPLLGAALGFLAASVLPPLQRALIPNAVLDRRVDRRASAAFVDEEIFSTRDRTGVLIFVALFEHRVRIVRDRGVEERVPQEAWQEIITALTQGLRQRRAGPALVQAVEACGGLLVERGVARRPDDVDELSDEPRLYDE